MINIEVLFPDVANLYGDIQNLRYLELSVPEAEISCDMLYKIPAFAKRKPDLIYLGSMTEHAQEEAVKTLLPYRDRLNEMIGDGVHFLLTGNALEIFGKNIKDENGTQTDCLDIIPVFAKRNMKKRITMLYLGEYKKELSEELSGASSGNTGSMDIVGFKSQFSYSLWQDKNICGLFDTKRGMGLNPEISTEGVHINNFMATYLLGPLLPLNPPFTKILLKSLGVENPSPAFENEAMKAYKSRIKEYSNPKTIFNYH